ncbi:MAG TPA: gamma-glutamyltransferase [Candidatus Nanopelagicales bacterium]|nr:gamma-glutamyltransferase [Candidatus Nanopelagicales bacterium]
MGADAVVTGPAGSAAVAAGSAGAVDAAVAVLRQGGSAVDAVLAAAFASVMTEPVLSSLGGGGFLLHAPADGEPELLDFFVAVPGLGGQPQEPHVETVVVDFAKAGPAATTSEQVFHGGWGTVAVPGALAGHLEAHRRWGRLPIAEVVAPAAALARDGVALSPVQRRFLLLVRELLRLTSESRDLFSRTEIDGTYSNVEYAALLDAIAAGTVTTQDHPAYADALVSAAIERGGLVTREDLATYTPQVRAPQAADRGDARVWTNPAPSAGGPIVLDALARLSTGRTEWASVAAAQADAVEAHRRPGTVPTGTTHVTVVDADGSFAALTTSNGSQSGAVVPGWGVTLNNMLGEEDLQPGEPLPVGARMGSMMAPTLVAWPDGRRVALGTGGSERIRSAILCVLARLVDEGDDLAAAVAAPRVHVSGDHVVHVEPGLADDELTTLRDLVAQRGWPALDAWPTTNIYFGGVHAVHRGADGSVTAVGDARRGGAAAVLLPDGEVLHAWSESLLE